MFRRVQTGVGWRVPKTLDLGTTRHWLNIPGRALENGFVNRIRKPTFPLNLVEGFSEHIAWPEAHGSKLNRPGVPVSFYVPLRKTTLCSRMSYSYAQFLS